MIISNLLNKLAGFSRYYMEEVVAEGLAFKKADNDKSRIVQSWWLSLVFFFDRVFYQGRRDEVSHMFEQASIEALEELLGASDGQKLSKLLKLKNSGYLQFSRYKNHPELDEGLKKAYVVELYDGRRKKSSTGKERDREMTVDTLSFIAENLKPYDYNILRWSIDKIGKGNLKNVYKEIRSIRQIGDKTASLFLRDVVTIFKLENKVHLDDYVLLQPVDTWVRKISKRLNLAPSDISDEKLKRNLVNICLKNGVSPIKLNQGIWYLGSFSLDILLRNLDNLQI